MKNASAAAKHAAFARSRNRCAFPGCDVSLLSSEGFLSGEVCYIETSIPGGPRYNAASTIEQNTNVDNLIVLCPNHHRTIDAEPDLYSVTWLREVRDQHRVMLREALAPETPVAPFIEPAVLQTLEDVVAFWEENKHEANEEFWQNFFNKNPYILALSFPDSVVKLQHKCYVGGKSIDNRHGNLLDFLYVSTTTQNVVLIEIKTPAMRLLGKRYLANAYAVSEDLSGAIVQVLNYREELLKSFYMVNRGGTHKLSVFAPRCVVLAGSVSAETIDANQRRSFELFRLSQQTIVLTYDELFAKLKDIVDLGTPQ